jgi:Cerato-platanin
MRLANAFASLAILLTSVSALLTASSDTAYDDPQKSLSTVSCSDGPNGLLTRNFTTLGSLPKYPYVGGAPAVTGWNSPGCGTCWIVTYTNDEGVEKSVNLLAIDAASNYNMPTSAMNELTDGQAISLGRVPVTAVEVPSSVCGLSA